MGCNAAESFLIHEAVADSLLPELDTLLQQHAVEIRGCEIVCSVISSAIEALEEDWYEEYLAPIVAIKVVQSVEEAIITYQYLRFPSHGCDCFK